MSVHGIEWAAGLFEGEGTIFAHAVPKPGKGTINKRMTMAIDMTDEDVILNFRRAVGCGQFYGPLKAYGSPTKTPRKPKFRWVTTNKFQIELLCCLFWQYLGIRRRIQIIKTFILYNNRELLITKEGVLS